MKLAAIVALALTINIGMFVLMESMISRDQIRVIDAVEAGPIEFLRTPLNEETRTRDRRTPPPPKPQEIDRPRAQVTNIAERASSLPSQITSLSVTSLLAEGGAGVTIGQTLVGGGGNEPDVMMADDLIPLSMLPPQYPPSAQQRNIEGWVDVIFGINEQGEVFDAEVVEAEPADIFDQAAINAAMRWRFRPVTEDGEATTVYRLIRINFSLQQGGR